MLAQRCGEAPGPGSVVSALPGQDPGLQKRAAGVARSLSSTVAAGGMLVSLETKNVRLYLACYQKT